MTPTATALDLTEVLASYLEAWNTNDPAERAALLERSVTDDVVFIDPMAHLAGRADLAQHIAAMHATYAGVRFEPGGEVDSHNNVLRTAWVAKLGDKVVLRGLDVDDVADDGRLSRIIGFFDRPVS
jgi:hypothetical protein